MRREMEIRWPKASVRRALARRAAAILARRTRNDTPPPSMDGPKSVGKLCATDVLGHFLVIESGGISRGSGRHATCKGYQS
jgi:hypothetical protein